MPRKQPIETLDPFEALRVMRGSVIAQIEANSDQAQYLNKQLQAIEHLAGLVSPEAAYRRDEAPTPRSEQKQAIDLAVRMYMDVKGGAEKMADSLNEQGVTTAHGNTWTPQSAYQRMYVQQRRDKR